MTLGTVRAVRRLRSGAGVDETGIIGGGVLFGF